ncbi:uncharacterized protein LOC110817066 [Carica papaya]|uniref:uncharacterized protein LOC110817066 n=1 Tax=Carica papaya TaxID=3649 RepID=UPI000B8CAA68|nr:uncharacterized protein LOC110817066 [Carica papaya]
MKAEIFNSVQKWLVLPARMQIDSCILVQARRFFLGKREQDRWQDFVHDAVYKKKHDKGLQFGDHFLLLEGTWGSFFAIIIELVHKIGLTIKDLNTHHSPF